MMRHVSLLTVLLATPPAFAAAARPADARAPTSVRLASTGPATGAGWAAGTIAAAERATLSTRLSAAVRAVHVEEGAAVARGQLLVSLEDADVRAQLAAAETALAAAAAHERRIAVLAAERAATPSELEAARAERARAEAGVAAARANLRYTEIRAPFAGTVQARRVDAGDLVGPGQPLVEMQGGTLEVQATLSEAEARGLAVGQRIAFDAGEVSGEARITALTPGGDPVSHRRGLRAHVVASGAGLRSGSFARVRLPGAGGRTEGAWVPRSALVQRGDLTGVFVVEDGRALLRWLSLGEPVGDVVPVRAGLAPGERVVDAPGALRDGDAVEVGHDR
jgi:RND family efflux transporter MFP subunit